MGAFARLGLLATASVLFSGVAQAAVSVTLDMKLYDSSGAEVTGTTLQPGTAAGDKRRYTLRIYRTDGGSPGSCTISSTAADLSGTVGGSTATTISLPVLTGSYFTSNLDVDNTPGTLQIVAASGLFSNCEGADSNIAKTSTLGVVAEPIAATLENAAGDAVGSLLNVDGATASLTTYKVFNQLGSIILKLPKTGIHTLTWTPASTVFGYFNWPRAWIQAGLSSGTGFSVTSATDLITITITFSALPMSVPPAVYEIELKPGMLSLSATSKIAGFKMRYIHGYHPVIYNAVSGQFSAPRPTSNITAVTYATNATKIGFRHYVPASDARLSAGGPLSVLYPRFEPFSSGNSAFEVGSLLDGFKSGDVTTAQSTNSPRTADFEYQAALSEGTYVFRRETNAATVAAQLMDAAGTPVDAVRRDVVLIIDRTPPVAANATFSGAMQTIGKPGDVAIPSSMFSDKISSDSSWLTVVRTKFIGSEGQGFSCPTGGRFDQAACTATTIRGPAGNVVVEITVADEAGNEAVAWLTIPVVDPLTVTLTVADKRGVYGSSVVTGGTSTRDANGKISVTVVATFSEPIRPATLTSAALSATLTKGSADAGTITVNSPTFSAGNRVATFTIVENAAFTVDSTAQIDIKLLKDLATRDSDGVKTIIDSDVVYAYIDRMKPKDFAFSFQGTQLYASALNLPFFAYLPLTLFQDDTPTATTNSPAVPQVSTAEKMKITAASTNQNVGLTVTVGPLGRAYISGTATSIPTAFTDTQCFNVNSNKAWVKFTITAEDEAGNTNTGYFCVQVVANGGLTASLSFNRNTLSYKEDDTATALDSVATFSASDTIDTIQAYLETPDVVGGSPTETLAFATGSYAASTEFGTATMLGAHLLSAGTYSAATVTTNIQGLKYSNTKDKLTPGFRTARIIVTKTLSSLKAVVAVTSKTIYVTNDNTQPAFTFGGLTSGSIATAWTEGSSFFSYGVPLFKGAYITSATADVDDDYPALATVAMETTASSGNYGACDKTRDYLELSSSYSFAPKVYGSWNPSTCTLTLKPLTGIKATYDNFREALHSVLYRNSDRYDPTNGDFGATSKVRGFSFTITDKAAEGKAAAPKTSTPKAGTLTPTLIDDEPIIIWENLYGPGGIAYSGNQTAAIKWFKPAGLNTAGTNPQMGANKFFAVRKFPLDFDVPTTGATSNTFTLTFDFSKTGDRMFGAKSAFFDYDTPDYLLTAGSSGVAPLNSIVAGDITIARYTVNSATGALTSYSGSAFTVAKAFASGVLTLTVTVTQATTSAGEYAIKITFGKATGSTESPAFYAFVDVRQKVCALDATNFLKATAGFLSSNADLLAYGSKFIYDPNSCQTASLLGEYKATVNAAPALSPASDYFKQGTTVLLPGDGAAGARSLGGVSTLKYQGVPAGTPNTNAYYNFFNLNETLAGIRHDMVRAGVSEVDAYARAAPLRAAARGAMSVYFEKDSFATTSGSFAFTFNPMGQYQANTLPAGNTGEILDANLAFDFGPACMKFVKPVTVCLFTGDVPSGYTRSIKMSSQRDCTDSTKGWSAWESLSGVTFDAVTGLICGNTTHFSALATFLTPLSASPTTSKAISMGGSCPNDCSGHGYCRSNGKCACFSGFNGNDCSARTCPVAESWDGGNFAVHQLKECAERGVCNTKTGQCACYPGFEGSACQRTACPNACSGHGQCKLLKDLPKVQATGYSRWEVDRLQKCVCDAGYTGLDCSERICPFGDDPETTCNDKRQIQQVKLDFGSLPGDANAYGLFDTDELALTFRSYFGQNLSVPRIVNVFASDGSGATNFARSLKSLPGFAVSDVSVSASIASDFTSAVYNVTFDGTSLAVALAGSASARLTATGNTVSGNQAMLICPTNSYGSLGCQAAGCRPKYKQARVLSQPTSGVRVSSTAILRQPDAITAGSNVGKWGVSVTVIIANRAETGEQTYNVTSKIYERDDGQGVAETPLPPSGSKLRSSVTLPYGLEVDFDAGTLTPGMYEFKWRLPTCSVTQVQSASAELELAECSRRGNCDRSTGTCKCFPGYSGGSCGAQTVVV